MDAVSAVLTGVGIGVFFSWKISLVCLFVTPFMAVSGYMNTKIKKGLSVNSEEQLKSADLLASDSIMNYKTVCSFA